MKTRHHSVSFTLPRQQRHKSEDSLLLSCQVFNHMLEPPSTFSDKKESDLVTSVCPLLLLLQCPQHFYFQNVDESEVVALASSHLWTVTSRDTFNTLTINCCRTRKPQTRTVFPPPSSQPPGYFPYSLLNWISPLTFDGSLSPISVCLAVTWSIKIKVLLILILYLFLYITSDSNNNY